MWSVMSTVESAASCFAHEGAEGPGHGIPYVDKNDAARGAG